MGITVVAYSPFAKGGSLLKYKGLDLNIFAEPAIKSVADKYKKTSG